jgi:NADH-quinone oxidoreductase subunit M
MLLSHLIFLPIVTALLLMFIPSNRSTAIRWTSLIGASVNFLLSVYIYFEFVPGEGGYQLVEKYRWVASIGADWHLGVDGISLFLVLLTTLLSVLCIVSSWDSVKTRLKEYHFFLLVLQGGMIGVFCALDLFLFYIMWEIMLVPIFFLIGVWGGAHRVYATMKFFLFTMAGSMLTMVVILYLYLHTLDPVTGKYTFNLIQITQQAAYPVNVQMWLFLAFGLAFAIKVPLFPLHTWLPDAHTEAPTAGSVILAGCF